MKEARTVQELIDLLQQIEDKDREICAWDRCGYYGTGLTIETAMDGERLIIESWGE